MSSRCPISSQARDRIPTLAGIKFTNPDLMASSSACTRTAARFDIPWGMDECLLAALALGAPGRGGQHLQLRRAVYQRLIAGLRAGDLATARRAVPLRANRPDPRCGYMGAAKAVMKMLGVDVGPARLPHGNPTPEQAKQLRADLETLGFLRFRSGLNRPALPPGADDARPKVSAGKFGLGSLGRDGSDAALDGQLVAAAFAGRVRADRGPATGTVADQRGTGAKEGRQHQFAVA